MQAGHSQNGDPVASLLRIMLRTLWMLHAAFWCSLVIYAIVLLVLPTLTGGEYEGARGAFRQPPGHWDQWQFFFAALGVVAVYVSFRLRSRLLDPTHLRRGAPNLYAMAARAQEDPGADEAPAAAADALTGALQDLLGRVAMAHVVLWMLAEIPAVLGVVDCVLTGSMKLFIALAIVSAAGLFFHRPSRGRLAEILGPLAG